jgi:hypothetical protein
MDDSTADVFANRDEPVPLLTVTHSDDDVSTSEAEVDGDGRRKRLKKAFSVSKMKGKIQDMSSAQEEKLEASTTSPSLHDRIFAK